MSTIKHSETTLTTSDGTKLYVQTWAPAKTPAKAQVLLIHGYLEHCGRYQEFATALADKNIQVIALDLRGHGKSSGNRGYIQTWSDYHQDVSTVLATLDTTTIPCFVLGHSNGGLLALDYFHNNKESSPIQGVIVTSPFLKAATELGWFKVLSCKALGLVLPKLTVSSDVKSSDLTHDQSIVKANDEDPLVLKKISLSWVNQATKTQARVLAKAGEFCVPLLFVYAVDDKIANAATNKTYSQAIKQKDVTILPRNDEYHEVLNEVNRKELYDTIITWIMERL